MYTMKESVAVVKEADAKKGVSPARSDNSIYRVRNEPERQLGSLRGVIGNIRRDGGTPSVESIATHLSGMSMGGRAPVLLALQRTHGNRYVQRVVSGIQAKLVVVQPGDVYEQEADRVAEEVMRMPEPQVQRQAEEEEEEELVQTKPIAEQISPLIQRQIEGGEEEEKEEVVQPRSEKCVTSSDPIRYVQRAVAWIQAKLKIGQPNDEYEQEADRVATEVVWQMNALQGRNLQRRRLREKTENKLLLRTLPLPTHGTSTVLPATGGGMIVPPSLETKIQRMRGGGHSPPNRLIQPIERAFGSDFRSVRIHTDTESSRLNQLLNARAFTVGQDIYFRGGQYQPETSEGRLLLAHELIHTVQQSGDSVIRRDLDRTELVSRAQRIFDAVESLTGTNEREIIEALRNLTPNDAEQLREIYQQQFSWQRRVVRSLPEDLIYELEDPIHRYRAFNLLHFRIQDPGAPEVGLRRPHITAEPELREVVPGTQVTYTIETPERFGGPSHRYNWLVRNDPQRVRERRRTASGRNTPYFFRGPRTARWEATWFFPGRHTVVCELSYGRQIERFYEYEQVVREPSELAEEALDQHSEALRPDLYLSLLELQLARLRRGNVQQNLDQIQRLEEAVERVRTNLEVPGAFRTETRIGEMGTGVVRAGGPGPSRPLRAVLVPTSNPRPVLLRLYVKPVRNGGWAIIDLTDPAGRIGPYEGGPRSDLPGNEATRSAIHAAWTEFVRNNQHPAGQLVGEPPAELGFPEGTRWNVHNDGISNLEAVSEWISQVGLWTSLGALALTVAPVPGARVTAALLIVSATASAAATTLEMLDQAEYGELRWDVETALDLLELAGSLAIGAGAATRLTARSLSITRLRSAVLISEGVDTGFDLASGVILTAVHYRRIQAIQHRYEENRITREEATQQTHDVLADALMQNGLLLLGVGSMRHRRRGRTETGGAPSRPSTRRSRQLTELQSRRTETSGRVLQEDIRDPDVNCGGGHQWTGTGSEPQWNNPDSTKAYDHIASTHGPRVGLRQFEGRMARTGNPQGEWSNHNDWVLAEEIAPKHPGRSIIDFGRPIGRVHHPGSDPTEGVTRAFVQRNPDGTINSAYPVTNDFTL